MTTRITAALAVLVVLSGCATPTEHSPSAPKASTYPN
jgi:uncharacterized protein YceK